MKNYLLLKFKLKNKKAVFASKVQEFEIFYLVEKDLKLR